MAINRIPQYMIEDVNYLYQSIYEGSKGDGDLANNYPPYDKVTRGDVIAGAKGEDQMGGTSRLKYLMSCGMTRKEALAQIDKENKGESVKESYDLDQLSILYLVKEGYAKDLRSAQVIYENASSRFKRELNEVGPLAAAIPLIARAAPLIARAAPAIGRAVPSVGRFLANPNTRLVLSKGKKILKDPRVRRLGKYALDQLSTQNNGENNSNEEPSGHSNPGTLSGFLQSAIGSAINASYDYGEADKLEESFYDWVDYLFEDGYDLSNYTWEGLFEYYCNLLEGTDGPSTGPSDEAIAKAARMGQFYPSDGGRYMATPAATEYQRQAKERANAFAKNPKDPIFKGKSNIVLAKQGGVEGTLDKNYNLFIPRKFGSSETSRYNRVNQAEIKAGMKKYNELRTTNPDEAKKVAMDTWRRSNPGLAAKLDAKLNKPAAPAAPTPATPTPAAPTPAAPTPAAPTPAAPTPAAPTPAAPTPAAAPPKLTTFPGPASLKPGNIYGRFRQ